jgi:hypothetical protein
MLALPPQAGGRGKRFLHDRRSIDEYLDLAAGLRGEPAGQDFQSRFYHVVIVRALRVDGDCAAVAPLHDGEGIAVARVAQAEHDDGARLWP